MAITVKHSKVSTIPDGDDSSLIRPSDWNQDHTLAGVGTAASLDAGVANGVATLDSTGKVPVSQIPALGDLNYQGTWNASTNTPTLASSVGTKGYYYVVSVSGTTNLNGITDWQVNDWAVYNGTAWQKIDNSDAGGDVVGPTSATDNAIARFDTTTGKLLQNSVVTIDDDGNIGGSDSIKFSGTPPTAITTGALWFDSTDNSLNFQQNAITQQIGEEIFVYGKASATITEGQLICKTGVVGASGQITFGPSPANLLDNDGIIGVATENISVGNFGRITYFGVVHGIDATGTSAGQVWADGDTLWYNTAGGGLMTNVKPVAPYVKYQIATVIHNGGGGSGSIQVDLQAGTTLGGTDNNVQLGTLSAANLLTYSTTSGYWKNTALAAGTGITVGNAASGVVTVTNSAPDQTVALTGAGTTTITGTYPNFTITSNDAYTGTVTSVSGTTGRITSTGGTTPVLDLTSGIATAGTTGSSTLIPVVTIDTYGRVTGITTAANPQGTVTSVTGTAPVVSSGGATPAISMPKATTSVDGYLSATDWTTFNNKTSNTGTVTSVAASVPSFLSVTGSPITTSGTLAIAYSGTALPVLNGGTGTTTSTGSGSVVLGTTPTITTPALSGATYSTTANLVAGTNAQGQGAITSDNVVVTTTTANPSGVTLPSATTGRMIIVTNKGTNPINVYPASGGFIDALSVNTAISIPVNGWMEFNAASGTQWYSTVNANVNTTALVGTVTNAQLANSTITVNGSAISLGGSVSVAPAVTYTSTYVPYGQGTTTPNQTSNFTFNGTVQNAPIQRASNGIIVNSNTVSASYTIATGDNAMSAGTITVASGQAVTVSSGSRWVIL